MRNHERTDNQSGKKKCLLTAAILILIAVTAVFIRLPRYAKAGGGEDGNTVISRDGSPFFCVMDGYYYVRMADEIAAKGNFGTLMEGREKEGALDMLSFAPEGRSAAEPDGMARISVWLWRFLNVFVKIGLHTVDFYMSCLFAVLTILAVYFFARRMGGRAGGLMASALTGFAPAFTERTMAGSFDTDMVQLLLTTALMLLMAEVLDSDSFRRSAISGVLFALTAVAFAGCWTVYSMVFVFLAAGGGFLYLLFFHRFRTASAAGYLMTCVLTFVTIFLLQGSLYLPFFFSSTRLVMSDTAGHHLPNMFLSVAELQAPSFASSNLLQALTGGPAGGRMTLTGGLGGIVVFILAVISLVMLAVAAFRTKKRRLCICFCILLVWSAGCLFTIRYGVRFIEHLAAPVGILAGSLTGMIVSWLLTPDQGGRRSGYLAAALLCAVVLFPVLAGSIRTNRAVRPQASRSSEAAMNWIRENADAEDAVIASWWDMGYYYSYESGHPVLWDGGSMDSVRAMLLGRVLTSEDLSEGNALLQMICASGNEAVMRLSEKLGMQAAAEALWNLISMDSDEAYQALRMRYGFDEEDARTLAGLIHPEAQRETYLVITGKMLQYLGWIEFFGNPGFSDGITVPVSVGCYALPDGTADMSSEDEAVQAFFAHRKKELIWRLYFDGNASDEDRQWFSKVFESEDDEDHVQVWKLNAA